MIVDQYLSLQVVRIASFPGTIITDIANYLALNIGISSNSYNSPEGICFVIRVRNETIWRSTGWLYNLLHAVDCN